MKVNNFFKVIWQQKAIGIFFLIAFALWYFNKMADQYTAEIEIPIKLVSDPENGKWIENPEMTINAHCMTDGRTIMAYRTGAVPRMSVPLSFLTLKHKSGYDYEIDNYSLNHFIQTQEKDLNINHIEDISRIVRLSKSSKKKVPVMANINATYAKQYMNVAGKIVLGFDSVLIEAPQIILDTIKVIRTEEVTHNELSSSVNAKVHLIIPENVYCQEEKVPYTITVDRYTQYKFKAKVQSSSPSIIGAHSGGNGVHWTKYYGKLVIIPNEVTIFVNLPMSAGTKEKNISAFIDFDQDKEGSLYEVQLAGIPQGSEIVAIEPRMVDVFKDIK